MFLSDGIAGDKKNYFTLVLALLAISVSLLHACAHAMDSAQQSISHDGLERNYLLHSPIPNPTPAARQPLLLVLHGGGGTHRGMAWLTKKRFEALADRDGFFVAYPQGIDNSWNDGRSDQISGAHRQGIDDVGFIGKLIDHLIANYPIDARRIFATGISNGGLMSFRLGCSLPDKIRAIAPVTAQIPLAIESLCRFESTVSLVVFNGTDDPLVPYNGGQIRVLRQQRGEVLSTDETIELWRRKIGCSPQAGVIELADLARDGTRVTKIEYAQCKNESKVVLYRIDGGGHTWPGGRQYLPVRQIGRTTRDIDGCDEIWEFFRSLNRNSGR